MLLIQNGENISHLQLKNANFSLLKTNLLLSDNADFEMSLFCKQKQNKNKNQLGNYKK